jgi:hypothetical protein
MKKIGSVGLDFSKVDVYFADIIGADTEFHADGSITLRIPDSAESLEDILDDLIHELSETAFYKRGYCWERRDNRQYKNR